MKNDTMKYGLAGIVIGGIAVWLLTLSAINSRNTGIMQMMGFGSPIQQGISQSANTLDAHFIEQMIPHHEDAIIMAKLAPTKAQHSEIKQLARNIIDSQSNEIRQMQNWYQEWFGTAVPTGNQVMNQHGMMGSAKQNGSRGAMHMGMMGNDTDTEALENTANFDKAFIEDMIPHHQMAVMMAQMLLQGTNRPEMKQLAQDIITAQTKEINQMRQWYTEWGY